MITASAASGSRPQPVRSHEGCGSMADRRSGALRSRRPSRADPSPRPSLRLVPSDQRPSAKEGARLARVDLALLFSSAGVLTPVGPVMGLPPGSASAAPSYARGELLRVDGHAGSPALRGAAP